MSDELDVVTDTVEDLAETPDEMSTADKVVLATAATGVVVMTGVGAYHLAKAAYAKIFDKVSERIIQKRLEETEE